MAVPNFSMPFNLQNTQKFDIRNRPSKYAKSDIRNWRFEQSEGIRPAEYFAPYKFLPAQFQDVETQDYAAILKGRVVSALSSENAATLSGIVYPNSSGEIPIGYPAPEYGSDRIDVSIDSFWGYDEYTCGLLVPCNGGVDFSGYYTAADVAAQTLSVANGGSIAVASGAFNLPANIPIGVAFTDWYQDIRGKYLNYQIHGDGGHVLTDWYVEVPYIKVQTDGSMSGVTPQLLNANYANLIKYYDINKKFTYLSVGEARFGDTFRVGSFVQSDLIGNYKLQNPISSITVNVSGGLLTDLGYNAYNQPKTIQTVGKILAIDNRMPKGSLEDVLTYPRSGMPGSQTAGMIKVLFDFAFECIRIGTGTEPSIADVYAAIRQGWFGLARINLSIS